VENLRGLERLPARFRVLGAADRHRSRRGFPGAGVRGAAVSASGAGPVEPRVRAQLLMSLPRAGSRASRRAGGRRGCAP
jgi:hypothetical protein